VTEPDGVEVSVRIAAAPQQVFPYFTDPARHVEWMGSEARLEPVPGGVYRVRMGDGFAAAGAFVVVEPPRRVVFTWGWADDEAAQHVFREHGEDAKPDGSALPPGSTRVVVTLDAEDGGTRLTLRHHDLPSDELREAHRVAWRAYLPRLGARAAGDDPGPDPHS
jgi:uncharacterized protein YndB with AHSA1/START domain